MMTTESFPPKNAICRDDGGGGNRTRESFPPEIRQTGTIRRGLTDWLYFIQPVGGGHVKIGRAIDPLKRLKDFQAGSPVRLRIIAAIPDGGDDEKQIHKLLSKYRRHGEWFLADGAVSFLLSTGISRETLLEAGVKIPDRIPEEFAFAAQIVAELDSRGHFDEPASREV